MSEHKKKKRVYENKEDKEMNEKNQEKPEKTEEKESKEKKNKIEDILEEKDKELENKNKEIKQLESELMRVKAEFHNYRKALEREYNERIKREKENVIFKLISLYEDFERALNHSDKASENLLIGIRMIYKQFKTILAEEGVEEILPSIGELFDPFRDEVAETRVSENREEMEIIEVQEKGYKFGKKILKSPKVIVAVKPDEKGDAAENNENGKHEENNEKNSNSHDTKNENNGR
ncbi:MAG: nucleotide exchange factor GrpE [Kosmotoga sp.]|nr:MAG: nucleotide exchange factor GrpE [Kosmotoga sp.]